MPIEATMTTVQMVSAVGILDHSRALEVATSLRRMGYTVTDASPVPYETPQGRAWRVSGVLSCTSTVML